MSAPDGSPAEDNGGAHLSSLLWKATAGEPDA